MVQLSVIDARLSQLGIRISRWLRPEVCELQNVLMENEQIIACVPGRYYGGTALLTATDQRLLLIDKKAFFMAQEDIRYDMISEVDYSARLLDAAIQIFTVNKQHRFISVRYKKQLRKLTAYVQQRVMELRQGYQGSAIEGPAIHSLSLRNLQALTSTPVTSLRQHIPHPHVPKIMGAAAINGARRLTANPYIRNSFVSTNHSGSSLYKPEF